MPEKLKFAVLGCGFWSHFQIPAWQELEGVELVAVYNRTRKKAEEVAAKFGVPQVYSTAEELLATEKLDFVDIITDVDTHETFVKLAAQYRIPVICQKPMAPNLETARSMVEACQKAGVPYFIHENFRWQAPIRKYKEVLESGVIGTPFKARISFCSSFPVFKNQPFLADLEEFILTDVGSHILDVSRFLFGEATSLYCKTHSIDKGIKGEDVANVLMEMDSGVHCYAEMSYASILEQERFPQTFVLTEGSDGSVYLGPDFEIRITTRKGTEVVYGEPKLYSWADPNYDVVHASIVACNRNILQALQQKGTAETTGEDNFKTAELVFASYDSARTGKAIAFTSIPSKL
ncbi:Gfo/Idh/MocA family oxidoreductase [Rhodocytophaga rosea]|uniref:Gfo/Idh/MocA family oxidoreductase n=1 Tax=Rhodocytophaga rosea TaxID=2704465 RepID=A0A6C0GJY1_9BACT|nr:Gfo/Idh/MocA family oxidoreductase [Rhodocytophaga rosea]QHT68346.1 Gfo/Idh/MocA family oxidoreductase [Rhodocytophaga rosea]